MLDTRHTSKHKLLLTINTPCRVSFVSLFVLDLYSHGGGIRTYTKNSRKIGCLSWQGLQDDYRTFCGIV